MSQLSQAPSKNSTFPPACYNVTTGGATEHVDMFSRTTTVQFTHCFVRCMPAFLFLLRPVFTQMEQTQSTHMHSDRCFTQLVFRGFISLAMTQIHQSYTKVHTVVTSASTLSSQSGIRWGPQVLLRDVSLRRHQQSHNRRRGHVQRRTVVGTGLQCGGKGPCDHPS